MLQPDEEFENTNQAITQPDLPMDTPETSDILCRFNIVQRIFALMTVHYVHLEVNPQNLPNPQNPPN